MDTLPKVTLYGIWNGKSGEDWQRRCLDVDCRSEQVHEKLRRDRVITTEYEATRNLSAFSVEPHSQSSLALWRLK